MTRRSLKPNDILLAGRMVILESSPPHLGIIVWCPFCKGDHLHSWPAPPFRSDKVAHRVSHCWGKVHPSGYYIGLDPSRTDHNREVIKHFKLSLARWESRKAAALTSKGNLS
ncbi:hypothetical protein [Singulisphaera sp. PoT]|uniref:hypothetical protein n=1 Tax=Singulisphaera sp. PoT TaxID=3411797 RepID=UPI003BF5B3EF